MENAPQRVLIIDTAWLGDVVFSTALLGAVVDAWPSAELHFLTAPRGAPILRGHPFIDQLWIFEKRGRHRAFGLLKLAARLRRERYDVVLCAHPSFRSRVLTRLTGAPVRIGYSGFCGTVAFTHRVLNDLAVEPDHVSRRLALLHRLRPDAAPSPLRIALQPEAVHWAEQFLAEHDLNHRRILGLIPGSAWETKQWPAERFAELGIRWGDSGGVSVIFGGRGDQARIREMAARGPQLIPVIGESLPHVAALLANCQVVVGNDTGVSFLAMAAGARRVIVLYGCTQMNYRFPLPHRAILAGVPCCLPRTGHGKHRCRWTKGEPWCMRQITLDQVWSEMREAQSDPLHRIPSPDAHG